MALLLPHYRLGVFLVAYLDDDLSGTGAMLPEGVDTCRIVCMSVRADLRGRGIGSAILDELVRTARATGYARIVLETTAAWTDAVAFYSKRGFRSVGVREGDHHFERGYKTEERCINLNDPQARRDNKAQGKPDE